MIEFLIDILFLRHLGLGRFFRYTLLVLFLGCLFAGLIYTFVFLRAASERSHPSHVHAHHTH